MNEQPKLPEFPPPPTRRKIREGGDGFLSKHYWIIITSPVWMMAIALVVIFVFL